jgi:hypothetical protein
MKFIVLRLVLDFGLLVLIWIIQRIIYPSFLHYNKQNLIPWHKKYTARFATIVIPLMFGQLGVSLHLVNTIPNLYTFASLGLVVLVWGVTFLQFVPIHSSISRGDTSEELLTTLVSRNWVRTILWTLLFITSTLYYMFYS